MKKKLFIAIGFFAFFLFGWLSAYISTQGLADPAPKESVLVESDNLLNVKVMYGHNSVIDDSHDVISYEGSLYFPEEVISGLGFNSSYNETSGVISFSRSDGLIDQYYDEKSSSPESTPPVIEDPVTPPQPMPKPTFLAAGQYVVGEDILAGKYDVTALSGFGNFMGDVASLSLGLNEILDSSGEYGTSFYNNLRLNNGDVIEIRGDLQIRMDPK